MCVRTKTSYGCGHTNKQDQKCYRHSCGGLERYHFEHEGDCRQCRKGGDTVSRGREGQGRYAREVLKKKDPQPSAARVPLSVISRNGQSSPWAPSGREEKDWRSPIRRQADEAWEEEHARRQEDLQSRSPGSRGGSVRSIEPDSPHAQRRRQDREAAIQEQLRKMEDSERIRVRRRRERQASHDSFDSFGESRHSRASSGLHSHGQHGYGSAYQNHQSGGRSRMYDSGFGSSKHHPYNLYNTESYFSGLGHGFGELVRDSSRRWTRW